MRKINLNSTGELIKFIANIEGKTISFLNEQATVSDDDIDNLNLGDVIELKIDRIENNTNRIYFESALLLASLTLYIHFYKLNYQSNQQVYSAVTIPFSG